MEEFPVRLPIKLGQFLKLASLAEHGAEARSLITEGYVYVNGELEMRRTHQLSDGDEVRVEDRFGNGTAIRVVSE
ncbi:ribosome-associated protein [Arcanobacterium pluranimalium]|uniref:RNA-binding S4 domain-containing protein n=1 Tax=Arcanobacterium pluranimalium TaxID=108028 RepID=UPI0019585601|nr:RNA-binding S4 domain-containing protein [Arcanobacterium pluranimalium]MBM7825582.1 ribosome-associated protein [Arcanobacterium pluranimalium]